MFLQKKSKYNSILVYGSGGNVQKGLTSTQKTPRQFNPGWFTGDHTAILGSRDQGGIKETCVEWSFPFEAGALQAAVGGLLIVACERTLAGLHSTRIGAQATVCFNGHPRDTIRLENT